MKRKLNGFTLVELIVVMAVMSILMVAIMRMFQPIRNTYVESTQYVAQRTAQNGVIQYITESVRYSTDLGIYDTGKSITSASAAVDDFIKAYCINKNITDASGNAVAPYNDSGELNSIKNEIKKYAEIIIIDNKTNHKYGSKNYTGRLIRRKFPLTPSATVPADPSLVSSATADWRIALSESYYGSNSFFINLTVNDSNNDGTSDDGMLNVAVVSTKNSKRDISKASQEDIITDIYGNDYKTTNGTIQSKISNNQILTTKGGVLCRNVTASSNHGVTKQGIFDVSKYSGSSATNGSKTYIVFLSTDGKEKVDAVVKTAATSP